MGEQLTIKQTIHEVLSLSELHTFWRSLLGFTTTQMASLFFRTLARSPSFLAVCFPRREAVQQLQQLEIELRVDRRHKVVATVPKAAGRQTGRPTQIQARE